jgi:hypothetical protein
MRMPEPKVKVKSALCTMLNGQQCSHFNGCFGGTGVNAEVICGSEYISRARARQCTESKRHDDASHAIGKT